MLEDAKKEERKSFRRVYEKVAEAHLKKLKVHKWDSYTRNKLVRGIRCMKGGDWSKHLSHANWDKVTCKACLNTRKVRGSYQMRKVRSE